MQVEMCRFDGRAWSEPFPQLDSVQTLVVVFGATSYLDDPEPIRQLQAAFPTSQLVGCSSAGEIHGDSLDDDSLSVAVVRFAHTRLRTAVCRIRSDTSRLAGRRLGDQLAGPGLTGVFVLSDGLDVNGSELVRGLSEAVGSEVVVTGGLAGDGDRFERTWTIVDGKPTGGFVVAVGFYGSDVVIGHGSRGGWDMFGPERRVTRAVDNILYELDGRPALALYKEYLGELAKELPASGLLFPLSLRDGSDSDRQLVRTILAINEEDEALIFAGDVPEGHLAQLMQANFDRLVGGAEDAATRASLVPAPGPYLTLAVSCVGRRLVLGERTEDEIEAVLASVPEDNHLVGFYSYGEISPHTDGTCDLHNQTMTLTVVAELP